MANIVVHHSVLCIATEASLADGNIYGGIPNWASYVSGIGIGLGFDIGASGYSPERIQFLMENIGIEQWQINEFKNTCYITFNSEILEEKLTAYKIVARLKDELKIKWTQQQCLDFLELMKSQHNEGVKSYFPKSINKMHDAVKEVFVKVHYGAPANCKYIGALFDSKFVATNSALQQMDLCLESLKELLLKYGSNKVYKSQYSAFETFINKVKQVLKKGDNFIIDHKPTTPEFLLNNDTCDYIADVINTVLLVGYKFDLDKGIATSNSKLIDRANNGLDYTSKHPETANKLKAAYKKTMDSQVHTDSKITADKLTKAANILNSANSKSEILQKAQVELKKLGFFSGTANGFFDAKTKQALKNFQNSKSISSTGGLDKDTLKLLLDFSYESKNNITDNKGNGMFDFINIDENDNKQEVKEKKLVEKFLENFKNYQPKAAVEGTDYILLFKNTALKGKGKISGSVGVDGNNKPEDVVIVRALLAKLGYLSFHIENSVFDFNMYASLEKSLCSADADLFNSIKNLQKDNGLAFQDARVDPVGASMTILNGVKIQQQTVINNNNNNLTPKPGPIEQPEGKEGLQKIQTLLIKEGFLAATYFSAYSNNTVSSADGVWGNASANALLKFQKKYGLSPTAKIDKETMYFMKNRNSKPKEEEFSTVEVSAGSGFYPCFN